MNTIKNRVSLKAVLKSGVVDLNIKTFNKAFKGRFVNRDDWRTNKGYEIVDLMREKVGYSCNTASSDIYWQAFKAWEKFVFTP